MKLQNRTFSGIMLTLVLVSVLLLAVNIQPSEAESGPKIDVYTQKGGEGLNQPDGFFGPREKVNLTAFVTYNDLPEANIAVRFEVVDPEGICVLNETAETDENGIANTEYTIPLSLDHSVESFGEYNVTAQATPQGQTVYDKVTFEAGWYVEITSIETGVWQDDSYWIPKTEFGRLEHLDVKLTYNKTCDEPLNVTFFIVAYDDVWVQILQWYSSYTLSGPTNETLFVHLGTIPISAYMGSDSQVFANAFRKYPPEAGDALCPEVSTYYVLYGVYEISFEAHCPVDLHVYDPEGRHVGVNETGWVEIEIPGARYTGPDADPEVILIPNPNYTIYTVQIVGVDTGTYRLLITYQPLLNNMMMFRSNKTKHKPELFE